MRAVTFVAGFLVACAPQSVVVHFDTDAPIRSTAGDAIMSEAPLFDALRVEVYPPNATTPCAGCVNDFDVTAEMFTKGLVSIGVPLTNQSGYVLRARLYLRRLATPDGPAPDASIDKLVSIPTSDIGMGDGLVFFDTDSAGVSHDPTSDTPDALASFDGAASSVVGTWPQAKRVACDENATPRPNGSVCIPGGAYWMGTQDGQPLPNRSATWHRLAVMSPFYLDADEVSVARFRAAGQVPPVTFQSGAAASMWCTFTTSPGPYESFPVNCVDTVDATLFCKGAGGAVPTGAQFEYVATQLGRSPYPWGFDEPTCAGVVWSRESTEFSSGLEPNGLCYDPNGGAFTDPSTSAHIGGPEAPTICTSSPACSFLDRVVLDATASPIVEVRNLGGNVAELTSDRPFLETSTDCWGDAASVIDDPACPVKSGGDVEVRAGDWAADQALSARAEKVLDLPPSTTAPNFGFRCAYPATPLGN